MVEQGKVVPLHQTLGLRGSVTPVGWELPDDLTETEWWAAGEIFGRIETAYGWWLGDWWNAHKPKWGNRAKATESEDWKTRGLPAYKTCLKAGAVARSGPDCNGFDNSRRREVLSWKHHAEVAAESRAVQEELLDWCEEPFDEFGVVRSTIDLRREIDRRKMEHRLDALALPTGRFPILLVDPPWRYDHAPLGGTNRAIETHYPTMSLDEICALAVPAADDANLYLWATAPKLVECLEVVKAWGFECRTHVIWVKDKIGMGYHARSQHELLLICKKGSVPPPPVEARQSSVIFADREEHSVKPDVFYEMIEGWYPTLPKVELFARRPRDGWAGWGNQLPDVDAAEDVA